MFLFSVGKCQSAKVNELTSSFLLNWRNPQQKLFNYWLRLTVKIACLVHVCLKGMNDFWKAENLEDDGRPCTTVTDDNNEKVRDVTQKDWRLGVQAVAKAVNLDRESVPRILREELNMRKVCAKMVPKVLSDEQKECCKELCLDLLQRIENEPDLLNLIITCDETWIFMYDLETKQQSMQWKSTSSPRPKTHAWVVWSSRPCWLFSSISRVLWWYRGYPAARR